MTYVNRTDVFMFYPEIKSIAFTDNFNNVLWVQRFLQYY